GHKRQGHGDHLVAGADPEAAQRQVQRARAAVEADAMLGLTIGGEGTLELLDARAEDETPRKADLAQAGRDPAARPGGRGAAGEKGYGYHERDARGTRTGLGRRPACPPGRRTDWQSVLRPGRAACPSPRSSHPRRSVWPRA